MRGPREVNSMFPATIKHYAVTLADDSRNGYTKTYPLASAPTQTFKGLIRSASIYEVVDAKKDNSRRTHVLSKGVTATLLKRDDLIVMTWPKRKDSREKRFLVLSEDANSIPEYERWNLQENDL